MPRHEHTYEKHMTQTDEGKALYGIWKRIRRYAEEGGLFSEYPDFFDWAMSHGYELGLRLRRLDENLPYGPKNCTFNPADPLYKRHTIEERVQINEWNRTVNLFRKHFGMKLFEVVTEEEIYAKA